MTEPSCHDSSGHSDQEVPVCLKCFTPYQPLQHYCQKCGDTVGQLSPYIPFINIPFNMSIFATMWRRIWFEKGVRLTSKVSYSVMIILFAGVMLIGLPFAVIAKLRSKKTQE